jgi:hypothetical protein
MRQNRLSRSALSTLKADLGIPRLVHIPARIDPTNGHGLTDMPRGNPLKFCHTLADDLIE